MNQCVWGASRVLRIFTETDFMRHICFVDKYSHYDLGDTGKTTHSPGTNADLRFFFLLVGRKHFGNKWETSGEKQPSREHQMPLQMSSSDTFPKEEQYTLNAIKQQYGKPSQAP